MPDALPVASDQVLLVLGRHEAAGHPVEQHHGEGQQRQEGDEPRPRDEMVCTHGISLWTTTTVYRIAPGRQSLEAMFLEVMGEGESMGPLNDKMKQGIADAQADIKYEIKWTTLGEYMDHLVRRLCLATRRRQNYREGSGGRPCPRSAIDEPCLGTGSVQA